MGAMGRYIAAIPEGARDRLISASSWISYRMVDGDGGGCLRGHAEGLACRRESHDVLQARHAEDKRGPWRDVEAAQVFQTFPRFGSSLQNPAHAFNAATDKFGMARVVRAIKLRAARLNGTDPQTIRAIIEQQQEIPSDLSQNPSHS